jgi:hypothetical protein
MKKIKMDNARRKQWTVSWLAVQISYGNRIGGLLDILSIFTHYIEYFVKYVRTSSFTAYYKKDY